MAGFSTSLKSGGEISGPTREKLRRALLNWYDREGRDLPWRAKGVRDPYKIWLSEIMLQQTGVTTVAPYFAAFLARFPSVSALAAAPEEAVLEAWAGLGYYSRARNLHKAARILARSGFPSDEDGWRALPGVGPYTAAALAAIIHNAPANVVDGNVERVMARLFAVEAPLPGAKPELRRLAGRLVTAHRPGDWAQALMDLGATVCTPRSPKCGQCPLARHCAGLASGTAAAFPRRAAKPARPQRFGAAFRVAHNGAFWLVRRPRQGLLAGMAGLPTTPWREEKWPRAEALNHAPMKAKWKRVGQLRHVFTHFSLTLEVYAADGAPAGEGFWGGVAALPSVFRKAAALSNP